MSQIKLEELLHQLKMQHVTSQPDMGLTPAASHGNQVVTSATAAAAAAAAAGDKLPIVDIRYVLECFLKSRTKGCGVCMSTYHALGSCPRAWVEIVEALNTSG